MFRWLLVSMLALTSFAVTTAAFSDARHSVGQKSNQMHIMASTATKTAAFAFVRNGNVPSEHTYSYRFPRDDKAPWKGNRPWLEISSEVGNWQHAGVFTTMTVVDNPSDYYLMDLYLHGDGTTNTPLIKIQDIDLRKFFPQPISNRNSCLAKIQNYFGEYNRKSRSITNVIPIENDPASTIYKVDLINNCREPGNWEFNVHDMIGGKPTKALHGYFFIPVDYLDARLKRYTGYGWRDAGVGLRFPRHPERPGEPNAEIPSGSINRVLASAVNILEENAGGDLAMMWTALPSFPKQCNIRELKSMFPGLPAGLGDTDQGKARQLVAETGAIDYSHLPAETRAKSGVARKKNGQPVRQTLSFVKTRACRAIDELRSPEQPPEGFRWPLNPDVRNRLTLAANKWQTHCAIVPHTYRNWEDIRNSPVRLSGFEGDGTYGCAVKGKTARERRAHRRHKLNDDLNCWRFSYEKYIGNFEQYRLSRRNGFTEVHLINTSKASFLRAGRGRSVIIGFNDEKLRDADDEGLHFLLGYNSKKLSAPYDELDVDLRRPHYAFVVDQHGYIKDHYGVSSLYRDGVGLGKVQVRLEGEGTAQKLIVTLISHERIMPLAQFKISYSIRSGPAGMPFAAKDGTRATSDAQDRGPQAVTSAASVAAFAKRAAAYQPLAGEKILADAVLSHGMTYHAILVKSEDRTFLRRYMPDGNAWAGGRIPLTARDGRLWETASAYAESYVIKDGMLEFYDHNGLVAKAPLIARSE